MTSSNKPDLDRVVDKLQQAGKIDNLQQVCGIFGCVLVNKTKNVYFLELPMTSLKTLYVSVLNGKTKFFFVFLEVCVTRHLVMIPTTTKVTTTIPY